MLPKLTQVQDTYQGQTVTVTKVEVDGEATLRLKDGLITDGTYIYRMIARADRAREIVVSIGNISVSYSLSSVYETFSQSYISVVAENNPCVTIIFPTGTYYLYQVELDGNSVSSDLLEHIEEVSTKTDEAYEKAYQAMPKYTTCSSAGSAAAKVTASITNFDTSLPAGMRVSVLMKEANLAVNPTLSVSNTPAYPILTSSGEAITADNLDQVSWPQNALVTFVFDGNNWRIDDSAALTKIDHILTENIVGDNGWINLKGGEFVFTSADTGDSIGFDDGVLNLTGTINGSTIQGEDLNIEGEGYESGYTPTPGELVIVPKYRYWLRTKKAYYTDTDENDNETTYPYKYVQIVTNVQRTTLAEVLAELSVEFSPFFGLEVNASPLGGYGDLFSVTDGGATRLVFRSNYDDYTQKDYTDFVIDGPDPRLLVNDVDIMHELFYKSGDTVSFTAAQFAGLVTSSAKSARFTIPVGKSMANITGITVERCEGGVRTPSGGYMNGVGDNGNWLTQSGVTVSAAKINNRAVRLIFDSTSAFTNVSNNQCLVYNASPVTLRFS